MKKFTCINDKETKVDGAIEGTKAQVLAWMKKTFPGIRERMHDEMMTAVEFFMRVRSRPTRQLPESICI